MQLSKYFDNNKCFFKLNKMRFFKIILITITVGSSEILHAENVCIKWFQQSGIAADSKGCLLSCDLIPKDMSTFDCSDRCEEFCKTKKCNPDPYWNNKLKNGVPKDWGMPTESPANWTDLETSQIMTILNQLPDRLKELPLDGIYRMKKSVDIINPGSTALNGKSIVIYDRAFHSPFWSLSSVITHELGHVVFENLKSDEQENYFKSVGWKSTDDSAKPRAGDFVSSRAKDNANEDFAENFSFFLLSRDTLRTKVPKAYDWFVKKYTTELKLKEDCKNGKN